MKEEDTLNKLRWTCKTLPKSTDDEIDINALNFWRECFEFAKSQGRNIHRHYKQDAKVFYDNEGIVQIEFDKKFNSPYDSWKYSWLIPLLEIAYLSLTAWTLVGFTCVTVCIGCVIVQARTGWPNPRIIKRKSTP